MDQVLFRIPLRTAWTPDGVPIYGFGAMLFLAFVVGAWVAGRRGRRVGIPPDRLELLLVWLFAAWLVGGRVLYFLAEEPGRWQDFFLIWQGGIVFYGGAIGGTIGAVAVYYKLLRPLGVSPWQVADVLAPGIAIGLMFGRLGCYLNGCCWGQIAAPVAPVTQPVVHTGWTREMLVATHFPSLTAPARDQLVGGTPRHPGGLQTLVGFAMDEVARDHRTVGRVEPGSPADAAGLQPGDVILGANETETPSYADLDTLVGRDWPRGVEALQLRVRRGSEEIQLPAFTPRLIGLYPTQVYEAISAFLLFVALAATWPLRRYDGQLIVLLMWGYAVHRFVNESLRDDTEPFGPLTLSQWISLGIFAGGVAIALLRRGHVRPATTVGSPASR